MKNEVRALLKERAKAMAREPESKSEATDVIHVISFNLAGETYGIEYDFVREVFLLNDLTILPGVPSHISGIINVRGQILPVVNIKKIFNIPERGISERMRVIILENEKMEFGILADRVDPIQTIRLEDINPLPVTVSDTGAQYLAGVTKENLIIINAGKLLMDKNLVVNSNIT